MENRLGAKNLTLSDKCLSEDAIFRYALSTKKFLLSEVIIKNKDASINAKS